MSVNKILYKSDMLLSAANRCQIVGSYAMATMYKRKAMELRRIASRIGDDMEREQYLYDCRKSCR